MKILDEMILLLGYLATPSGSGASSVFAGWRNGVMIVQALCDLDISYFISPARREVLLPSLVISTYYNPELLQVMEESVSRSLLQQYLGGYVTAAANGGVVSSIAGAGSTGSAGGGAGASAGGGGGGAGSGGGAGGTWGGGGASFPVDGLSRHWHSLPPAGVPWRFHLATRLAASKWEKALGWFQSRSSLPGVNTWNMSMEAGGDRDDEDEDEEEARGVGEKKSMPSICLSEAEVLKLSRELSSCTSGHDESGLSAGGGGGGRGGGSGCGGSFLEEFVSGSARGEILSSGQEGVGGGLLGEVEDELGLE
jgi:hypothetical protein